MFTWHLCRNQVVVVATTTTTTTTTTTFTGWGVFAATNFQKGDVIEVAPLWVGLENTDSDNDSDDDDAPPQEPSLRRKLRDTILDQYYLVERWEWNNGIDYTSHHSVLIFGTTNFYNPGRGGPANRDNGDDDEHENLKTKKKKKKKMENIKLLQWGEKNAAAFGHYALRDIAAGEELVFDNGSDDDDDEDEESDPYFDAAAMDDNDNTHHSKEWRELYTSKIYAGHGRENCHSLQYSVLEENTKKDQKDEDQHENNDSSSYYDMTSYIQNRLSPLEAGYRNARAKVPITHAGTVLEIVPALMVDADVVRNTILEPMVLFWNDLEPSSLLSVLEQPNENSGGGKSVHQGSSSFSSIFPETSPPSFFSPMDKDDEMDEDFVRLDNIALVPLGGSLALLERTVSKNPNDYNCQLQGITLDRWNNDSFTIRIVATKPMEAGERLVLKVADMSSSNKTRQALWQELVATKQPFTPAPPAPLEEEKVEVINGVGIGVVQTGKPLTPPHSRTNPTTQNSANAMDSTGLESWQQNYWYMAPCTNSGTRIGWGVFAAKSFQKGDMIEVAPMWIGFENSEPLLMDTVLYHYVVERWEWDRTIHDYESKSALIFGPSHMFNHGQGNAQNIKLLQLGNDDSPAFGHYAIRDITMGEELLANYGGPDWFLGRDLALVDTGASTRTTWSEDAAWRKLYTSKIYTGHGQKTCRSRRHPSPSRIVPFLTYHLHVFVLFVLFSVPC
jgi:hypothetical protein